MTRIERADEFEALFADIKGRNTADYLIRTAQQHHVHLSAMADTKANIIITVSSIVLTLSIGRLNEPSLLTSTIVLMSFTLIALLLAVLAVLPKYRPIATGGAQLPMHFNVMFFGHFAALDRPEYYREMAHALKNDPATYHALANDLYSLGYYLAKHKYRYLRFSYIAFLAGFLIAALLQVKRFF
jgi:hypothetical protein